MVFFLQPPEVQRAELAGGLVLGQSGQRAELAGGPVLGQSGQRAELTAAQSFQKMKDMTNLIK